MARNYFISGSQNVASPTASVLGLTGATTIRPVFLDMIVGSTATPADNALEFIVQRYTASGTGDAVTPQAADPADPASLASSKANHSAEPTYTSGAIMIDIPMNQRATQRWVPSPGREIKIPATANNGLGIQPVHASFTGLVTAWAEFED